MINDDEQNLSDFDIDFNIVEKDFYDIINEINFKTEEDKLICESIIDHIEQNIAHGLKNMKIVQLPYVGTLRIDPVKKEIKDHKIVFQTVRKTMNKEEYKQYARDYITSIKEKHKNNDRLKIIIKKIRKNNNIKYNNLCKKLGRAYAEMFIYAIYLLEYVPYDKEWEEHYNSLKD